MHPIKTDGMAVLCRVFSEMGVCDAAGRFRIYRKSLHPWRSYARLYRNFIRQFVTILSLNKTTGNDSRIYAVLFALDGCIIDTCILFFCPKRSCLFGAGMSGMYVQSERRDFYGQESFRASPLQCHYAEKLPRNRDAARKRLCMAPLPFL